MLFSFSFLVEKNSRLFNDNQVKIVLVTRLIAKSVLILIICYYGVTSASKTRSCSSSKTNNNNIKDTQKTNQKTNKKKNTENEKKHTEANTQYNKNYSVEVLL